MSTLRDELRALIKLAVPLGLAQAGQALMGVVDTAVVGRLSDVAQGAVGLGNGLYIAVSVLGVGLMLAFDPLISQAMGAKNPVRARTLFWQAMWMAVIAGLVLVVPLWLSPRLLPLFGVDDEVARGASTYVMWRLPSLMPFLLFLGARTWLQSSGRTTMIFVAMLVANVVNLLLDLWLVFGGGPMPSLGVAGSAIATTLATWLQLGLLLCVIGESPPGTSRRLSGSTLRQVLGLGLPIGAQMLAEVGVFVLAGVLAGRLGHAAVAAHQVAITWASLSFCFTVGIGSAAATRVGWSIGAGDSASARRSGVVAFGLGLAWMSSSAMVFLLAPRLLARAMTADPAVIDLSISLIGIAAFFQISDGMQAVGAGALRGTGDTRLPFIANLVGHWVVGLPVAVYLGIYRNQGVVGLWWGLSAGLTAVAIALVLRFLAITRKRILAIATS